MPTTGLSDIDYNALVNSVFDVLKGGNVELGKIVDLGQMMVSKVGPSLVLSLEKKKALVSEIVQKAVERVELVVLSKLPDAHKKIFSEQLSLVVSQVKEKVFSLLDVVSVNNPYLSYLFGLCCLGGPLPVEPSVVKPVDTAQTQPPKVQDQVEKSIQEPVTPHVTLTLLEPRSDVPSIQQPPPSSKVAEENPVVVASKVPESDMD